MWRSYSQRTLQLYSCTYPITLIVEMEVHKNGVLALQASGEIFHDNSCAAQAGSSQLVSVGDFNLRHQVFDLSGCMSAVYGHSAMPSIR